MGFDPPLELPKDLELIMRSRASRSAFLGAMLDVNRRKGGLTHNQLDMVRAELKIEEVD